jgi:FtsZ-binding cell division protein ZapB
MIDWIVPIVIALVAALPGLLALIQGRRRQDADAAEIYEGLAARSGERWRELIARIDALEKEVSQLRTENISLRGENSTLKSENETLRCEIDALRSEVDGMRRRLEGRRK